MKKLVTAATLFIAASAFTSAIQAAPISWSTPFDSTGSTDVVNNGVFVEAFNMGAGASDVTVNSVDFTATNAILNKSTSASFLSGATSGDSAYDDLLDSLDFGNGTSHSIEIGGGDLKIGTTYTIQAWFTDLRSCCNDRTMVLGDGGTNTVGINASGAGLGQFAIGTFVADAGTQTLSLASPGFGNVHLSAYQVREVPAPATLALMGLALLGFGIRRRA